jgi:ketosteroid isomerase-like protein
MSANRTEQDVLDLVQRWAEAERQNDSDLLDGLLAADFVAVGPRGFVLTRDQGLQNTSFEVRQPQVRDYGTAAVVVAEQHQQATHQGRDVSAQLRATVVAVRPDDRWLVAGVHLSPIAGPL